MSYERHLSAKQAGEILNVSPRRIYWMIRRSGLPAVRIGRTVRISEADLKAWVELRKRGGRP